MKTRKSIVVSRGSSVMAVGAALSIPWLGWGALVAAVGLAVGAAVTAPQPQKRPHKGAMRAYYEAVQRRFVRHPWRPRQL